MDEVEWTSFLEQKSFDPFHNQAQARCPLPTSRCLSALKWTYYIVVVAFGDI